MNGERAYWCLGGNFMLGRFFRGGKVRPGCFFPRGKIYTSIFFRGRFYPGAVFPGGNSMRGGGGNSMLQHRHCQRLALHMFLDGRFFPQVTYFHFAYAIGGRPFDSEGGGGGWHFVEINILTLKMLKINNLSSSVKKINNLTLTFLQFVGGGGGVPIFPIYFC